MKQLFWKEWHELRLLPLAAAFSMGLLLFGARVFLKDANQPFQFTDTFLPLCICWVFFGLLSAAPLFSQEVGDGSLMLLSALPLSRRRIWGVKAATGFGVMVLCLLASAVVWDVVCYVLFGHGFSAAPLWQERAGNVAGILYQWEERSGNIAGAAAMPFLAATLAFAAALAVSTLLDRVFSVLFAALLLFFVVLYTLTIEASVYAEHFVQTFYRNNPNASQYLGPHLQENGATCLLLALMIPVFAAVSYWTFTRGESLRSAKRFGIGALVGSASLSVAALTFCCGSCLHWW